MMARLARFPAVLAEILSMRFGLIVLALLELTTDASAACRCACVRGVMRPICQQTDLIEPICAGLCTDDLRPDLVVKPIAGGRQALDPIHPFDPAPNGLEERNPDLNTDSRGYQLGTAGVDSGTSGFSSGNSGGAGAAAGSVGGR